VGEQGRRKLLQGQGAEGRVLVAAKVLEMKWMAGDEGDEVEMEDERERVSSLFSHSLSLFLLTS
jgi:hypothetical protein